MTAEAKLRRHRELGVQILMDFRQAMPETAAGIVEGAQAWKRSGSRPMCLPS